MPVFSKPGSEEEKRESTDGITRTLSLVGRNYPNHISPGRQELSEPYLWAGKESPTATGSMGTIRTQLR